MAKLTNRQCRLGETLSFSQNYSSWSVFAYYLFNCWLQPTVNWHNTLQLAELFLWIKKVSQSTLVRSDYCEHSRTKFLKRVALVFSSMSKRKKIPTPNALFSIFGLLNFWAGRPNEIPKRGSRVSLKIINFFPWSGFTSYSGKLAL